MLLTLERLEDIKYEMNKSLKYLPTGGLYSYKHSHYSRCHKTGPY